MHVRVTPSLMAKAADVKSRALPLLNLLRRLERFAAEHEQALFWALALFYRIGLDLMYCFAAYPLGGYMIRPFYTSAFRYFVSFALYLILYASLPRREKDGIAFAVQLQFVYTAAPILTLYAFSDMSGRYMLMVSACILLENLLIFRPLRAAEPVRIRGVQNYVTVLLGVLIVFAAVVPILYNGFAGLKAFNFRYIYEMRANASYPPGFGYLLNWMTKAIIPFGFLCFLHMRKYRWAVLLAAIQIFFYMLTGQKITLFILVPMVFVYFCVKTGHCLKLMYLGLGAACLFVILACRLDRLAPIDSASTSITGRAGILAASIIAVRALFIPAGIKSYFYDFFSSNPKLYFSDGQIGRMLGLTYPYKGSSGQVINAFQMGVEEFGRSNSNTGYLGEAYAQMGFAGMLLMSVLLALILRSLRVYDRRESAPLLTALISIYIIILNDGAFLTTLFTGGLLVTYILIFIYFDKVTEGDGHGIQRL